MSPEFAALSHQFERFRQASAQLQALDVEVRTLALPVVQWVEPRRRSAADLARAEALASKQLPPDFRRFVLEFGDEAPGPAGRLPSIETLLFDQGELGGDHEWAAVLEDDGRVTTPHSSEPFLEWYLDFLTKSSDAVARASQQATSDAQALVLVASHLAEIDRLRAAPTETFCFSQGYRIQVTRLHDLAQPRRRVSAQRCSSWEQVHQPLPEGFRRALLQTGWPSELEALTVRRLDIDDESCAALELWQSSTCDGAREVWLRLDGPKAGLIEHFGEYTWPNQVTLLSHLELVLSHELERLYVQTESVGRSALEQRATALPKRHRATFCAVLCERALREVRHAMPSLELPAVLEPARQALWRLAESAGGTDTEVNEALHRAVNAALDLSDAEPMRQVLVKAMGWALGEAGPAAAAWVPNFNGSSRTRPADAQTLAMVPRYVGDCVDQLLGRLFEPWREVNRLEMRWRDLFLSVLEGSSPPHFDADHLPPDALYSTRAEVKRRAASPDASTPPRAHPLPSAER